MAIEVERMVATLEANFSRYDKALNKALGKTDATFSRIERRGSQLEAMMGGLFKNFGVGFLGGAAAALAPLALIQKAIATIDEASALVEAADRIGLTTKALQELQFGFSQAGVAADAFTTGMDQFTKRIGAAATGGGKLAEILQANGVAIRDADGNIRSSESLLRDYADLIKNAASEQEKLLLVTEAFGRGGGDMVTALNDGAAGIDKMKKAAAEAGGVIDEELLRKAEELGDRWDAAWHRFEISSKTAILTAVEGIDAVLSKFRELDKQQSLSAAGLEVGALAGTKPRDKGDRLQSPIDKRVGDAFGGELQKADEALVEALQKRYGKVTRTIIPGDKENAGGSTRRVGRDAAAEAALREAAAVTALIEELQQELDLVGASDAAKRAAASSRMAGAAATDAERQKIVELNEAIHQAEEAQQKQAEAIEAAGNAALDGVSQLTSAIDTGNAALDQFLQTLIQTIAQAAFLGTGPLGGLFGGGLFGRKGFADGGYTGAGGKNTPAGTVHRGEYVFSKKAVDRAGVGNLDAMHRNLKGFAGGGLVGVPAAPMAARGAAPRLTIQINETGREQAQVREASTQPNGDVLVKLVIGEVKKDFGRGGFDKLNAARYGLTRNTRKVG